LSKSRRNKKTLRVAGEPFEKLAIVEEKESGRGVVVIMLTLFGGGLMAACTYFGITSSDRDVMDRVFWVAAGMIAAAASWATGRSFRIPR